VRAETLATRGVTLGAASAGGIVWRLGRGIIEGLHPSDGRLVAEASVEGGVEVAGSPDILVVLTQGGDLVGIDPVTGATSTQIEVGSGCHVVGGQDAVWLHQPADGVVRRISGDGTLHPSVAVGSATHLSVAGEDLWWVAERDTLRSSSGHIVDLVERVPRSGAVACAGSVWLGAMGYLIFVSLRAGVLGPSLRTDTDTPLVLACAGGRIVGADSTTALVMDPAADANVVRVGQLLSGPPVAAVGFRNTGWILSEVDALLLHF